MTPLACTPQGDPSLEAEGLVERFDGPTLGDLWTQTGGPYRIQEGQLVVRGAQNRPLWLRRRIPDDVRIRFDATALSPDGDIKVEVFGDGTSAATAPGRYTASGYVVIFGGWNNSTNLIARLDEHGADRALGPRRRVEVNRTYRFVVERRGRRLSATVDGELLASMEDEAPLRGRGHDHFAFNNWASHVRFDNLIIKPLAR